MSARTFLGATRILSDGAQWFSPHKAKLASRNSHAPWNICQKKFKICSLNFPPLQKKRIRAESVFSLPDDPPMPFRPIARRTVREYWLVPEVLHI